MSRFAKDRRVFFVEEPLFDSSEPGLTVNTCPQTGVHVVTPHLNCPQDREHVIILEKLLTSLAANHNIADPVVWFYTPMALEFYPVAIEPSLIVYDCMDELSLFRGAPGHIQKLEAQLLSLADLVFTGGISLFEAKRNFHPRVHPFPSGVDTGHFLQARGQAGDYRELEGIPHPRLGYAGVIDERIDLALIDEVARRRPEWQIVMIGPTAKISPDSLPSHSNIHWLGIKSYADLPKYFAGWDIGIMPFALNDSTRFISPTKTPEYLSAGLPVVSSPIRDVVRSYGDLGMVRIAHSADEFIHEAQQAMSMNISLKWRERVDDYLKTLSWDSVWNSMNRLIAEATTSDLVPAAPKVMTAGSSLHV